MVELNKNFRIAVFDLRWLLNRGYPKKPSVELVGNRYRLSADERMMLYRGVYDEVTCRERRGKKADLNSVQGQRLAVDGYNVFITLESYLTGKTVFRSLDGYVRDVATACGNYTFGHSGMRCTEVFINFVRTFLGRAEFQEGPAHSPIFIYLDYPVSRSGEFASYLRKRFEEEGVGASIEVVKDPDRHIAENHRADIVATSDTALIDRVDRCFDVPDAVIRYVFNKELPDLEGMLQ